jgi:beta-N-acetylhexosaminidase
MLSEQIKSLSIEQKVGQLFFIGISGATVDDDTSRLLAEVQPGGVCLFARNIKDTEQTRMLLDDLRGRADVVPFLSVDQEGGLVDRLRRIMGPMPAADSLRSDADAGRLADLIAETLRILGFNMDFAPVVDVSSPERKSANNGLYSRTFGSSAEDVTAYAGAFLERLQANGIIGCIKHFPGLGASSVDSHDELPTVNISETELFEVDVSPYRELLRSSEVAAVMVAHAAFPQLRLQETGQNGTLIPSSLSRYIVSDLLRSDLDFQGIVLTDDLEMGAIIKNYGIGDACKLAIQAGEDMLCICAGEDAIRDGYEAVLRAVKYGEITRGRLDASLERIARVKERISEPLPFDNSRLRSLSTEIALLKESLQ